MKRALKFVHTLGAVGVTGALAAGLVLLAAPLPADSPLALATLRSGLDKLFTWILLPSLLLVLISGLLSIAVHAPFREARWVWVKALLGLSLFEGILGGIQGPARRAAEYADALVDGTAQAGIVETLLPNERILLSAMLVIAVVNIVLAIWRPRLRRRRFNRDAGSAAR